MALARLAEILPGRRRKAAAAYIASWLGAAAASILLLGSTSVGGLRVEPAEVLLFLFVTAAADSVVLRLHRGEATEFISLLEAAICINIVLFPPVTALAVTVAGSALSHVAHRQHPVKAVFNLAQYAVGTALAIGVFHLIGGGGEIGIRTAAGLMAGIVAFGIVNSVALSGLVSLLEERPFRQTLEDGWLLSALTVLGNASVGILAAIVWLSNPELTVLFLAPAATLHLAYRGVVRTRELLEEVVSERDRLDRIVGGASDGIALIDADGKVGVWSPAMTALTGVAVEDANGCPVDAVFSGADLDGNPVDVLEPMRTATPAEPVTTTEMFLSHRAGDTRVVRVRHTVLFDNAGRATGDAVLVHDITREHESDKLKDDFLARVSHELRTPLTPIKGYAQTLLRRGDAIPKEMHDEVLGSIVGRADHMQKLIDDLLLVSRIVTGRASLADQIQPSAVDLRELCEGLISSFEVSESQRGFSLEVSGAVPLSHADPARVEQIVTNLISNACKYSDKGSPVKITIRGDQDHAFVDVTDQGRGISPHYIERVFERFFRVEDPLTMTTGGVGLGLHISQQLAHAMDGELTVQSSLDEGSTFTLRLPLVGNPSSEAS